MAAVTDRDRPVSPPDRAADTVPGRAHERLEGWKSVAGYLGRDIRTVQRWERREGLPVHRHEHHKQASAYAYRSELDDWLRRRSREAAGSDEADAGEAPAAVQPTSEETAKYEPAVAAAPGRRITRTWRLVLAGAIALALAVAGLAAWQAAASRARVKGTQDRQAYAAFAEGQAFYNARQYQKAVVALDRAVSRDPHFAAAWAMLAKAHGRLAPPARAGGEPAAARATDAGRRAAALAPNDADVRVALALAARARGDVAAWRAEARAAIRLDPRAAEAYALLGDSYSATVYACNRDVDAERADAYYRQALELKPDLSTAITNRATNLRRLGRYDECIELADGALRSLSDEVPLRFVRGSCRLEKGDLDGAARDLEPLRDSPKLSPVSPLVELGLLALMRGQTDEGVRDLEVAARIQPGPLSDLFVAEAYAAAGDMRHLTAHLARAFSEDAACRGFVAASPAFARVRQAPEIRALLGF
jgi:tetratricopeptide (TPR) repeat protein